jgi:hypothetical protein
MIVYAAINQLSLIDVADEYEASSRRTAISAIGRKGKVRRTS